MVRKLTAPVLELPNTADEQAAASGGGAAAAASSRPGVAETSQRARWQHAVGEMLHLYHSSLAGTGVTLSKQPMGSPKMSARILLSRKAKVPSIL